MMRSFLRTFGRGLFAVLPTFLSVYILIKFFRWFDETVFSLFIGLVPPEYNWPGLGFVAGILFIFLLGVALSNYFGHRAHLMIDGLFRRVPLVKSVYTAIQDLTDYFSPKEGGANQSQVVAVSWPGTDVQTVGLVTRTELDSLPAGIKKENRVAVFLPMSYQMGGFTVFLPKDRLTPLNMSVEKAMRSALTGWMKKDQKENSNP